MTYSNGQFNPNPFANPFNTRFAGNYSLNPVKQQLPIINTKKLEVPNQDVPSGDQTGKQGFIGNSSIFRCHDGTIVDYKTGKILSTPDNPASQYWGNQNLEIRHSMQSWNDEDQSLDQLINKINDYYDNRNIPIQQAIIDQKSAAYWLKAQEEAEKLKSQMSDEQKKMIDDFEKHFPKSKFIEESKKNPNNSKILI